MKLIFKKPSKEQLGLVNKQLPNLSSYMDKSYLKKIGKRLGITEESAKYAVFNSLEETLGWHSEKRIDLWFSTLTICIDEIDPLKRWEKVKSSIINTLAKWVDNPVWPAFEIIRDPKQPIDIEPKGLFGLIDRPVLLRSVIECCLQTVILFNARDRDIPSDVFYWGPSNLNFCEWRFRRQGFLFKIELKNGDIKEKFIKTDSYQRFFNFPKISKTTNYILEKKDGSWVSANITELLHKNISLPKDYKNHMSKLFNNNKESDIANWLKEKTGREFNSREKIKEELKHGYSRAFDPNVMFARKHFPEYKNKFVSFKSTWLPYWVPNKWLMDSHKLRIDLGDSYLAGLSKNERIKIFEQLIKTLGFSPLINYVNFRNILSDWEKEKEYDKNQSFLKSLKKRYSKVSEKKEINRRDYARITLKVIENMIQNKTSIRQASNNINVINSIIKLNLSLRANLKDYPKQIRVRVQEILREENKLGIFDFKSQEDLKRLRDRIKNRYELEEEK